MQKKTITAVFFLAVFFLALFFLAHNYAQSERFGDETAHMMGGHYLLKGKMLYRDMQLNHQPLNYLFSASVEIITKPNSLFSYLSRQREAIALYSFGWSIIYILFLGPAALLFIVPFEILKYWFSGYKLLGETLAVYPFVFMAFIVFRLYFRERLHPRITALFFGIASFTCIFSLFPLWPAAGILNLAFIFAWRRQLKIVLLGVVPQILLATLLFTFVPFAYYVRESIIYNIMYFLPDSSSHTSFLNLFIQPVLFLLPPYNIARIFVACSITVITIMTFLMRGDRKKGVWFLAIILLFIVNGRADNKDLQSFHLLPWIGLLIVLEIEGMGRLFVHHARITIAFLSVFLIATIALYLGSVHLFSVARDPKHEYHIGYSESESYGRAIGVMKQDGDRLVAYPNDTIVHYVADIDFGTRLIEYYNWTVRIPGYNKEIRTAFTGDPPEFFLEAGLDPKSEMGAFIQNVVSRRYKQIYHVGEPSRLYVLEERYESLTPSQWEDLADMLYTKSEK